MAISDSDKYILNNLAGLYPTVKLGDLIEAAEEGGLADDAVTTAKIEDLAVTTGKLAADAVTNAKVADGAISVEHLDSGIAPSHFVKFAGEATTVGGAAAEAITVTGLATTDLVFVTIKTTGATPRTIVKATPTLNTLTVTFSGDPSNDHVVHYMALRAAT